MKSCDIMLKLEATLLDIMGKLKAIKLSDDEDEPLEKRNQHKPTTMMNCVNHHHGTLNNQSVPPRTTDFAGPFDWRNGIRRYTITLWEV